MVHPLLPKWHLRFLQKVWTNSKIAKECLYQRCQEVFMKPFKKYELIIRCSIHLNIYVYVYMICGENYTYNVCHLINILINLYGKWLNLPYQLTLSLSKQVRSELEIKLTRSLKFHLLVECPQFTPFCWLSWHTRKVFTSAHTLLLLSSLHI